LSPSLEAPPLVQALGLSRIYSAGGWFSAAPPVAAVGKVDLAVERGEMLAIVGESGCGKSTLGRLLLGLEPASAGEVRFEGRSLQGLPAREQRALRARMQLVFQNPMAALDPRLPVGAQVVEPLTIHRMPEAGSDRLAVEQLFAAVGLSAELAGRFPHQLSGGQRQRVVIARALATEPDFVVFDEPVSALDVSVQAQIIALIRGLQRERGFAGIFISHDLRVVRHIADRVAVMYLGRIVEEGPVASVLATPAHPYTQALVASVPRLKRAAGQARLRLEGDPPSASTIPTGCAFHPRCAAAQTICRSERPALSATAPERSSACHFSATREPAAPSLESMRL